jgi:hypothetical protein
MTIMYYVTLSFYRIDRTTSKLAIFSTFACANAIYCCELIPPPFASSLTFVSNLGCVDGLVPSPAEC